MTTSIGDVVNQLLVDLQEALLTKQAEIEQLRKELHDSEMVVGKWMEEIERLRQQVAQRGARMQVMREWMTQAEREDWSMIISTDRLYEWFLYAYPEAADWFDADGVPF